MPACLFLVWVFWWLRCMWSMWRNIFLKRLGWLTICLIGWNLQKKQTAQLLLGAMKNMWRAVTSFWCSFLMFNWCQFMCLKKLSWAPTSTRAEMWLMSRRFFCTTSPLSKLPRWKLSAVVSGFFLQKHRRFPERIWKLKHGHAAVVLGCWIARSWGEPTKGHVSEVEVAEAVMFDRTDLLIATCLYCNQSSFQRSTLQKVKRGEIVMGSKWRKREFLVIFVLFWRRSNLA